MRPHVMQTILTLLCLSIAVFGCSTAPGGSEDPADFKTSLTPAGEAAPAAAAPAESGQIASMQSVLEQTLSRLDALEQDVKMLKASVDSIKATATEALDKAEGPLANIDLSDETEAGKALMEQSLEQIIGISKLLLDKMENELSGEPAGEAASESEAPQTTNVEESATEAQ